MFLTRGTDDTDEEIGGQLGMKLLVDMKEFKDLNVGFALDEGIVSINVLNMAAS